MEKTKKHVAKLFAAVKSEQKTLEAHNKVLEWLGKKHEINNLKPQFLDGQWDILNKLTDYLNRRK